MINKRQIILKINSKVLDIELIEEIEASGIYPQKNQLLKDKSRLQAELYNLEIILLSIKINQLLSIRSRRYGEDIEFIYRNNQQMQKLIGDLQYLTLAYVTGKFKTEHELYPF